MARGLVWSRVVVWSHITSTLWRNVSSASFGELDGPSDVDATILVSSVILDGHLLLHLQDDGEELHSSLLKQRESLVADDTDIGYILIWIGFIGGHLIDIEFALVLALVYQVVGYFDCVVRVIHSLFVLVDLAQ